MARHTALAANVSGVIFTPWKAGWDLSRARNSIIGVTSTERNSVTWGAVKRGAGLRAVADQGGLAAVLRGGGLLRRGGTGRGRSGGTARVHVDGQDRRADLHRLAGRGVQFGDHAGPRAGQLDRGLGGL